MKKGLALFDFDGTITRKDSASEFFKSLYKSRIAFFLNHVLFCLPEFFTHRIGLTSYLKLKKKRINIHLNGISEQELQLYSKNFKANVLPGLIKMSALDRIIWHKKLGHEIWIVSASFDFLIEEWCQNLDLGLISNKIVNEKNSWGFNSECNFQGKVKQIKSKIDLTKYSRIYAYGDSNGDKAMLSLAHESYFKKFI